MKKIFIAILFTTISLGAQAQTDTLRLDLQTALDVALSENPTIKVADMEIRRFDYVRRETMGNHLPQLSVGGQYTFNIIQQEMSKGLSLGADMSAAATGNLTLPLFAPAVYAGLKMNRMQQELAVEQARASRIDLSNSVKKAFFQILLLEKSHQVLRQSEKTIGETVANTRTMYDAGLASEYDLLTAEVQLSNLQPSIIQTENGIAIAIQMFKMFLSIPENVPVALDGVLDDYREELYARPEPVIDLTGNSEMRQLEYQQMLTRQQIRLTNAARLPSLAAYGQVIVSGQDKTIDFADMMTGGAGVINKWWWQNPATAGFQISIPILSGFKNNAHVRQLKNSVAQIELQKDYLRQAKEVEATTAVNNLMSARATMFATEKTVAQAEKAYSISRTRFDAGAGTMLEVNQAELAVTQSRLNHSQAIYDFLAAEADYNKTIGKE